MPNKKMSEMLKKKKIVLDFIYNLGYKYYIDKKNNIHSIISKKGQINFLKSFAGLQYSINKIGFLNTKMLKGEPYNNVQMAVLMHE